MSKPPEDYGTGLGTSLCRRREHTEGRKGIEIKALKILVWLKVKAFNHIKNNDKEDNV